MKYALHREQYLEALLGYYNDERENRRQARRLQLVFGVFFALVLWVYYQAFTLSYGFWIVLVGMSYVVLNFGSSTRKATIKNYERYIDKYMSSKIGAEHEALIEGEYIKIVGECESIAIKISSVQRIIGLQSVIVVSNLTELIFIFPADEDGKSFVREIEQISGVKMEQR